MCLSVVLAGCLAGGCSRKAIPAREIVTETVYRDRTVEVAHPADSGRLVALLRCDSANRVIMEGLTLALTERMAADVRLDSVGRLLADFRTRVDTVRVAVTDTVVRQGERRIETVKVEKELNAWQRFCLLFTPTAIGCALVWVYCKRKR